MGHTNMTIETIADMVWALDHAVKVEIYDPSAIQGLNYKIPTEAQAVGVSLTSSSSSVPDELLKEVIRSNSAPAMAA